MRKFVTICVVGALLAWAIQCSQQSSRITEIRHFPIDNLDGLLAGGSGQLDLATTSDGHGSLRIDSDSPQVVRLFEVDGLLIEDVLLVYEARIRTEDVRGQVYLEMWCNFPGQGEFFSRGLRSPLTGSNDWTTASTPFLLKKGQRPDRIKLNLVIDGTGTAWIDDIRLLQSTMS